MDKAERGLLIDENTLPPIVEILRRLKVTSMSRSVLLVGRGGHVLASEGDVTNRDVVSISSLIAGHFAAAEEIGRLSGDHNFHTVHIEGDESDLLMCRAGGILICSMFDERTTVGLVRLRTKKAAREIEALLGGDAHSPKSGVILDIITDEDIDGLFN